MKRWLMIFVVGIVATGSIVGQDFSFDKIWTRYPTLFDTILSHKQDYRLQILYTRIDRDASNKPVLHTYSLDADQYYYYCASLVKLPEAALTLEKINRLSPRYGVSMYDSLAIDTIRCDDLSPSMMLLGQPYSSPAQYIKEMLLVSNNKAFNPLYDFLGQGYFQDRMRELGYTNTVICNRFSNCDTIENRFNNPVSLFDYHSHRLKYGQSGTCNLRRQYYEGGLSPLIGEGYQNGNSIIHQPKDFRFANYMPLSEVHHFLISIILPETQTPQNRLDLTPADYQYLRKCMGMYPRECAYPQYDTIQYPDNMMKYFMGMDSGVYTAPTHLRIFNKVGQAYGFMSDCSYVSDTLHGVEFFLSCGMYLNRDGILNDGKYEYDQVGYPFFQNLFNAIYQGELERTRSSRPALSWGSFADTVYFTLPHRPEWQQVDSGATPAQAERVLCRIADVMWNEHNPPTDELSAADIFKRNLSIVLSHPASLHYPFDSLRGHHISILTSADGRLRVYSWQCGSGGASIARYQYADGQVVHTLYPHEVANNAGLPALSYTRMEQVVGQEDSFYLLFGTTSAASGSSAYLQAYHIADGKLMKAKLFTVVRQLYTDLLVERNEGNENIEYDVRSQRLQLPIITRVHDKVKHKLLHLRFDGRVFK